MWYTGIDQHRQFCVLTTYGPEGPRVKQARVASTALALAPYFAALPGPHKAVVESTGGWYWLADALAPLGVELVLAHATRLKAISAAKVKTDQVDSDILALLLRADLIPTAHMIRPDQRGPRDLMRLRLRLVAKCVSAQNSVDRLLEKFNLASVANLEGPLPAPRELPCRPDPAAHPADHHGGARPAPAPHPQPGRAAPPLDPGPRQGERLYHLCRDRWDRSLSLGWPILLL